MKHLHDYFNMVDDFVDQAKHACRLRWALCAVITVDVFDIPVFNTGLLDLRWTDLVIFLLGFIVFGSVVHWRTKIVERNLRAKHRVAIHDLGGRPDQHLNGGDSK